MKCLSSDCHHRTLDNRTLSSQKVPSCFLLCPQPQEPVLFQFFYFFIFPNRLVLLVLEFNINGVIQHAIFSVRLPSLRIMFRNPSILLHVSRVHYFLLLVVSHTNMPQFIFMLIVIELSWCPVFWAVINKATVNVVIQIIWKHIFFILAVNIQNQLCLVIRDVYVLCYTKLLKHFSKEAVPFSLPPNNVWEFWLCLVHISIPIMVLSIVFLSVTMVSVLNTFKFWIFHQWVKCLIISEKFLLVYLQRLQ